MAITNQNLFDYISLTVHSGPGGGQKPKKLVLSKLHEKHK